MRVVYQGDIMAGWRPQVTRSLRRLHTKSLGRARYCKERFKADEALLLVAFLWRRVHPVDRPRLWSSLQRYVDIENVVELDSQNC